MELRNKIVVITGGGSGIGKALATRFKAEGTQQIVVVDTIEKFIKNNSKQKIFLQDKLHYKQAGSDLMADQIFNTIIKYLK